MKPDAVIRDLKNSNLSREEQRKQADLLTQINTLHLERLEQDQNLEAGIQAMEMAFRMQFSVPEVFDVSKESEETRKLYGESEFAKGCLIARRLVEEGVRVVQLSHSIDGYDIAWDTGHGDIAGGHAKLAKACDQGIAALLKDLEGRGLLEETLVVWGGEFGRAPTSEGKKGRDHDHYGYTTWMAGGGVKKGFSYGATDEFGLSAVENRVHVHDMNATILHLMGLDHKKLTYRYSGRDYRLTDVPRSRRARYHRITRGFPPLPRRNAFWGVGGNLTLTFTRNLLLFGLPFLNAEEQSLRLNAQEREGHRDVLGVIGILVAFLCDAVVQVRVPIDHVGRVFDDVGRGTGLAPGQGHRRVRSERVIDRGNYKRSRGPRIPEPSCDDHLAGITIDVRILKPDNIIPLGQTKISKRQATKGMS